MKCNHELSDRDNTLDKTKCKGLPYGVCVYKCRACKEEITFIRLNDGQWIEN